MCENCGNSTSIQSDDTRWCRIERGIVSSKYVCEKFIYDNNGPINKAIKGA